MKRLLFFLVSASCSGYMWDKECPTSYGVTALIQSGNVECSRVETLVGRSREILDQTCLVKASNFKSAYSGSSFLVLNVDFFYGDSIGDGSRVACIGYYDVVEGIKVSKDGCSLLHEQLHMWDAQHLAIGTSWHENWDKNGYHDAAAQFEDECWQGLYLEESSMTYKPDAGEPTP